MTQQKTTGECFVYIQSFVIYYFRWSLYEDSTDSQRHGTGKRRNVLASFQVVVAGSFDDVSQINKGVVSLKLVYWWVFFIISWIKNTRFILYFKWTFYPCVVLWHWSFEEYDLLSCTDFQNVDNSIKYHFIRNYSYFRFFLTFCLCFTAGLWAGLSWK